MMLKDTYETREKLVHLYLLDFEWRMVAKRVGFVPARNEPKASCGVPEFSLDANDRA